MQIKALNSYRIIHKDGSEENINAEDLYTALDNMVISEETSTVISVFMMAEDIRTVVADDTEEDTEDEENNTDNTDNEDVEIGGEVDLEGNV